MNKNRYVLWQNHSNGYCFMGETDYYSPIVDARKIRHIEAVCVDEAIEALEKWCGINRNQLIIIG